MQIEKDIKVRLSKKISLYGKFSGRFNRPLFIMVHGLPGSMDEEFYRSAVRWFGKRGFSTFRFNLYGHEKDARQLVDCTLKVHASDLDAVVRYFRKRGVKKIFIAGHSFGGPTILYSRDQDFNAVVLWDPSYKVSFAKKKYGFPGGKYVKEIDAYLMRWGVSVVIGRAMAKEADGLEWDEITASFRVPFEIIIAGNGLLKSAKNYLKKARVKTRLVVIGGATHYFDDEKKVKEGVFESSKHWFRKFMKDRSARTKA